MRKRVILIVGAILAGLGVTMLLMHPNEYSFINTVPDGYEISNFSMWSDLVGTKITGSDVFEISRDNGLTEVFLWDRGKLRYEKFEVSELDNDLGILNYDEAYYCIPIGKEGKTIGFALQKVRR